MEVTTIRVRRGINGSKYSACDENGYFLRNFQKLSDVRQLWKNEIKWGRVVLIRELDKQPDMSKLDSAKQTIEELLMIYAKRRKGYDRKSGDPVH